MSSLLVLNAGSSSIKFTVFEHANATFGVRYNGQIEGIGVAPHFRAKDSQGAVIHESTWQNQAAPDGHSYALEQLTAWLGPLLSERGLLGIGHRVVHGGPDFNTPALVTDDVLQTLERYVPLAPLHQPANIAGIRAVSRFLPGVPQVACFDTAFHRNHPTVAGQFGLPQALYAEGVRRYGFHGLSYEYIAHAIGEHAPEIASGRLVVAHLGNGASMCAIHGGRSLDSTMSFTALDGLPMGTRSGQVDPGVLLYLMQQKGMGASEIEDLLYRKSGLLGMSGISSDMRVLTASDDPNAAAAIAYFVYHIVREAGALAAAMGGIDALIFTAGIGENAPQIRAAVCTQLAWLGIALDATANDHGGPQITMAQSPVSAWVIPTNEELMIAQHTVALIDSQQ